ncbi:MAG: T9SS type A sorting domain-containing protein [Dysgonamonadaceae bacterium]|jgi:uncharacterized membrane protein|nr:T9SS type A sorting domain-containing protein [Dysgonamonadaceae bacterium]
MKHLLLSLLFFSIPLTLQSQSLTIIESDNGGIYPHAISTDGRYVVGQVGLGTSTVGHHTFVWSAADGLVEWDQNAANRDGLGSTGVSVSLNGRVVGMSPDTAHMLITDYAEKEKPTEPLYFPLITASFRDYAAEAWTTLPLLPDIKPLSYGFGSRTYDISDDGNIIVGGQTPGGQSQRFSAGYWDVSNPAQIVYQPLLTNAAPGYGSVASAISGEGQVIGGQETDNGNNYTVLWINGEKKRIAATSGEPVNAISRNGAYAVFQNDLRAVIYAVDKEELTRLDAGAEVSTPLAVSDNGVVVGYWNNNFTLTGEKRKAFIYSPALGMLALESFLNSRNIASPLDSILVASGISADGRAVTGFGMKNGKVVGFYVEIPEISGNLLPIRNIAVNTPVYGTAELTWDAPEISDENTPVTAYRIYESETLLETVDASTRRFTLTAIPDGTYLYSVKAVYGQTEAIAGKTVTLTMSKKTIPFYDPFSDYQPGGYVADLGRILEEIPLSTGGWDVSAHTVPFSDTWKINQSGRPPYSARFVAPLSGEYSESLSSPFFDLREAEDLFLAFEVGIPKTPAPNRERLAVEIYDGENWRGVDTIPADGGTALYTNFYYDVSEYAGKDNARIRFRCFGTASTGINWFVENVELTDGASRIVVKPPLVVQSHSATDTTVHINWSDPYGNVSLRYLFDDNAYGALGNDKYPYIVANMYPAEDLSAYEGYRLTSVSFWRTTNEALPPSAAQAKFRWFVSQGGERLFADEVINPKLMWNTVRLDEPIAVDVSKPLYYGVEITEADPNDFPIGSGAYYVLGETEMAFLTKIDGRGNLYSENGGETWKKVSDDGGDFIYDLFCIRATLSKDPELFSSLTARRILGYKIYRNGQSLLEEEQGGDYSVQLNNFTDVNPPAGELCYTVKALYADYEGNTLSEGTTGCVTVTAIQPVQKTGRWSVYPNPAKRNEVIRVEVDTEQIGRSIRLYDLAGKAVKEIRTNARVTPLKLNVAQGIYILEITNGEKLKLIVE